MARDVRLDKVTLAVTDRGGLKLESMMNLDIDHLRSEGLTMQNERP